MSKRHAVSPSLSFLVSNRRPGAQADDWALARLQTTGMPLWNILGPLTFAEAAWQRPRARMGLESIWILRLYIHCSPTLREDIL